MKYEKILTWACTAALFLTGCTTDTASNSGWMDDSNAVRIQASAGSTLTRSNPIDESKLTGFNRGDKISVSNRNITVNYTFDGEKLWVPEKDKYLVWDEKDLKFEAYYPCDGDGKNTFSVGYIKKNQSTPEALAQSDYMNITSTLPSIPSDKHLTLNLERKTARLILKIQHFNDEFSEGVKVTELGIGCPENTNGEGSWESITPYQNGDGGVGTTYTALVIPGKRTVYITPTNTNTSGEPEIVLKLETGELEAGKSYTYNLIVGKNKVTVGGVTVAPWNKGNPLQGGEAEEEPPYVTMTANSKQTFKMTCTENYTLPDLEYSVNNGRTWKEVVADNPVEFGGGLGSLLLRGICPNGTAADYEDYSTITFSNPNVKVKCSGDIRTLIDYTAYKTAATGNYCFISLFKGCTALTSAPELPATKLAHSCYSKMFEGCTSLVKAPDLPATTLAPSCYFSMFKGCIALTGAPELKAEEILNASYQSMFEGCTSLVNAPDLQATILAADCYTKMFKDCISLKTAPVLPAGRIDYSCYSYMFENCENLESVTMLATSFGPAQPLVGWLDGAGTKATNRTLKVYNWEAYKDIITDIPDIWQKGKCTVWDKDGNKITTTE